MVRPHYTGSYQRQAAQVRAAAYANPLTPCQRCGRTLDQHPPQRNGKPPRWDAGHIIDGLKDGPLAPEVASCNRSAGATMGNQKRNQPPRTPLTW